MRDAGWGGEGGQSAKHNATVIVNDIVTMNNIIMS